MIRVARLPFAAVLLLPSLALASVGEVSVLEGQATRTPKGGAPVALQVGSKVEVEDTLKVAKGGNMKLTLSDESVLMVGGDSELRIDKARFNGLDREEFSVSLTLGKVWAKVKKAAAGSDQNFAVTTDRAVAGVRGTIFRVDAAKVVGTAKQLKKYTVVRVVDGKVAVNAKVKATTKSDEKAPPQLLAQVGLSPEAKGPRRQVEGPKQVSKKEWEERFVELQKRYFVALGEELWDSRSWEPETDNDAFAQFVKKHAPEGGKE